MIGSFKDPAWPDARATRAATTLRVGIAIVLAAIATPVDALNVPDGEYIRVSWNESSGLIGTGIWSIAQDRTGYIWLATNAGLVRFDGVRFVPWSSDSRESTGLPTCNRAGTASR